MPETVQPVHQGITQITCARFRIPDFHIQSLKPHLLDLLHRDFFLASIVELCRAGRRVIGHVLGKFEPRKTTRFGSAYHFRQHGE